LSLTNYAVFAELVSLIEIKFKVGCMVLTYWKESFNINLYMLQT